MQTQHPPSSSRFDYWQQILLVYMTGSRPMENLMKQMGCANQMKKMSLGVVAVLRRRAVEQYVVLQ